MVRIIFDTNGIPYILLTTAMNMLLNFCLCSIFMNGMCFYFKTTSKIVLTFLFSTKKVRDLDLA